MRHQITAGLLALFALSPALAARSPLDTVNQFYTLRLQHGAYDTPTGLDLAAFSSYLAPELVCMLGAAIRYSDQYARALPDQPRPFANIDLYASGPTLPSRFTAGSSQTNGSNNTTQVSFSLDSTADTPATEWVDTVHVSLRRKRWLISDIEYGQPSTEAAPGSLMGRLREVLTHPHEAAQWDVRELGACVIEAAPVKATSPARSRAKKASAGTRAKPAKPAKRARTTASTRPKKR